MTRLEAASSKWTPSVKESLISKCSTASPISLLRRDCVCTLISSLSPPPIRAEFLAEDPFFDKEIWTTLLRKVTSMGVS